MPGPMPFDGKRMSYGGFAPLLDERGGGAADYTERLEESNDEEEHDLPVVRP